MSFTFGYLRPASGCMSVGCVAAGCGDCCLGLVTLVLLLANSSLRVCGKSGSNLTPCSNKTHTASIVSHPDTATMYTANISWILIRATTVDMFY